MGGGKELNDGAGEVDHPGAPEDDQCDGQRPQSRGGDRVNLIVADREQSDDHHVERVAHTPAGHQVPDRPQEDDDQDVDDAVDQRGGRRLLRELHVVGAPAGEALAGDGALLAGDGQSRTSIWPPFTPGGSRPSVETVWPGEVSVMSTQ